MLSQSVMNSIRRVWMLVCYVMLELLQHLCCSYPAVAMVNTNMVANRGISSPLSTLLDS